MIILHIFIKKNYNILIYNKNITGYTIRTMFTIIKNSVKQGPITTHVNKIQLSNNCTHWSDTLRALYNDKNMEKIFANPKDEKIFLHDICNILFEKRHYPIELNTQINILQSIYPHPIYSRNLVLDVLKSTNRLPNDLLIDNATVDKKVNINFIAEAYLLSNTNLDSPKITSRTYYNEKDKIDSNLSMQHVVNNTAMGNMSYLSIILTQKKW